MNVKRKMRKYNNWERENIPRLRKNIIYKILKTIILLCLVVPIMIGVFLWYCKNKIIKTKITRVDKPDIYFKNIVDGFTNLAFSNKEVELLATKRADICSKCPYAQKTSVYSIIVDKKTKNIQGMKCGKCGCNLSAKIRSVSDSCPIGKW